MKTKIILIFFVSSMFLYGQVLVGDNGYKQVETSIAVHPSNSNIMATTVIELIPQGRQCLVYVSTNGGAEWNLKKSVNNVTDPVIDFDGSGNIFFCYLNRSDYEVYVIKSTDLGTTWSIPKKVSNAGDNGADKEWIAIDRTNDFIYIAWWEPEGALSVLKFYRSTDGGS